MIRRFRPQDAEATRAVFVEAVLTGAASRYSTAERASWVADPAMPPDWGKWLDQHITFVAEEERRITGFMMPEASGHLNMAFVLPDRRGKGVADALYAAVLEQAGRMRLPRLHVLASRYTQSFFTRHGWRFAPELTDLPGLDPKQGPADTRLNRATVLSLEKPQ